MNKLVNQNTNDLKKSLDKIKQEKIELNKNDKNSTNNKNENDRLNPANILLMKTSWRRLDEVFRLRLQKTS